MTSPLCMQQNRLLLQQQCSSGRGGTDQGQEDAICARGTTFPGSSCNHCWLLSPALHQHSSSHCLAQGRLLWKWEDCHDSYPAHGAHTPGRSKRRLRLLGSKPESIRHSLLDAISEPHFVVPLSFVLNRYFVVAGTLRPNNCPLVSIRLATATAPPVVGASLGCCWEGMAGRLVALHNVCPPPWAANTPDYCREGPTPADGVDY